MRSLVVILALSTTLVGCQTPGVAERSEPEEKGYLYDSGSRKAAETAGQPLDMEPGQQASSDILVSRGFPGQEPGSLQSEADPEPVNTGPQWVPLVEGAEMAFDTNYARHPQVMQLNNGALLFNSQWEGYLKNLVQSMRPEVRQAFLDGITRHSSEFDQVERSIVYGPKISSPSPYRNRSHIGIAGVISSPMSSTAFLKLYYFGSGWIFADRVAIRVDDEVLRFDDVDFGRDNAGGNVWETSYLNLSIPAHRSAADKIIESDVAIVRLSGDKTYDIRVTDRMKSDIAAMLAGIDAIRGS